MPVSTVGGDYRKAIVQAIPLITGYLLNDAVNFAYVRLFTNDIALSPDTAPGDLTVPTYTGYADKSVGTGPTVVAIDPTTQDWQLISTAGLLFQPSDNTNLPIDIFGVAVLNHAKTKVLFAFKLDATFTFRISDNVFEAEPILRLILGGLQ